LRAKYLVDVVGYTKVRGQPFGSAELADVIRGVAADLPATSRATEGSP